MNLTANEVYLDGALRHHIGVRRYQSGLVNDVTALLEKADADLSSKLRERLARFGTDKPVDVTSKRWQAMLDEIRNERQAVLFQAQEHVTGQLGQLAPIESQREIALLHSAIPVEVSFVAAAPQLLTAIVTAKPFNGHLLKDWFEKVATADQDRLIQHLQMGMTTGQTTDQIVRNIIGTRANNYADGITGITRRDAQAIIRTATNHVSNAARELVWQENSEVLTAKIWVSTLDGRTSAGCRARDGRGSPTGNNPLPAGISPLTPEGIMPPAHISCRSLMVAYISPEGLIGNRPYVTDTRTRQKREIDFRKIAKEEGKTVKQVRDDWKAKNIGQLPANTSYNDFLRRQDPKFQDEVLGKTKAKLFREGNLKIDQFVDRQGNELTLSQLAKQQPEAFKRAGLDVTKF